MLTVLVSTISNSQVFLLKKCEYFFSKNISVYAIFNDQSFNDKLTNNIVSFEQLGPDIFLIAPQKYICGAHLRSALTRHNICFRGEITKILCGYSLISRA